MNKAERYKELGILINVKYNDYRVWATDNEQYTAN